MGKKLGLGIHPYAVAIVHDILENDPERSRNVYQADQPSIYFEAYIGISSKKEIQKNLELVIKSIKQGTSEAKRLPHLAKWIEENGGNLSIEDLESVLKDSNKRCMNLIRKEAFHSGNVTSFDTLEAKVNSRSHGSWTKSKSAWGSVLMNFEVIDETLYPTFERHCQCFANKHLTQRRKLLRRTEKTIDKTVLDRLLMNDKQSLQEQNSKLHFSCYHEAVIALQLDFQKNHGYEEKITGMKENSVQIPFNVHGQWDIALETFAMRYKYRMHYVQIDSMLFNMDKENENIISPFFRELQNQGIVGVEVVKSKRKFGKFNKLVVALHENFYRPHKTKREPIYAFNVFAREFIGMGEEERKFLTSAVYDNVNGKESIRVYFNPIYEVPMILVKKFNTIYEPEYNTKKRGLSIRSYDDRTGQQCIQQIYFPSANILNKFPDLRKEYEKIPEFMQR